MNCVYERPLPFSPSQVKLSDQVHYGFGCEEGGTIADVVNDHKTIGPVDLLIESGFPLARLQRNQTCIMSSKENYRLNTSSAHLRHNTDYHKSLKSK